MRTSGNLWLYVGSKEAGGRIVFRLINTAHIGYLTETSPEGGAQITMSNGTTLNVEETFDDLTARMADPLDEGRLEVAFTADIEDANG
jgi:hypothetical protein